MVMQTNVTALVSRFSTLGGDQCAARRLLDEVTQALLDAQQSLIEFQRTVLGDARGMSTNAFTDAQSVADVDFNALQDLVALRSTLAALGPP